MSPSVRLAAQIGRVPSAVVPLDARDQARLERLMADLLMIDLHQVTLVMPHDLGDAYEYATGRAYTWGCEAIRAGGWSTVGAACNMSALMRGMEGSFISFADLLAGIALLLADITRQPGVVPIGCTRDIEHAHQAGNIGVLHGVGVRMAGLTYTRHSQLGDGQNELTDAGLSELKRIAK